MTASYRWPIAFALILPATGMAGEWEVEPRVSLGASWTDNITLAESGQDESDWVTELRPGIAISYEGPRATGELDYEMQVLRFDEFSDSDGTFNRFDGVGNVELIPDSTFVDAFARYGQLNVDTRGRLAFSNVFDTDNRTDYGAAGISPYHEGTWGDWGESTVRVTAYDIRYRNTDAGAEPPENTDGLIVAASLGSPSQARGISWQARGSFTGTNFEEADKFRYAQGLFDVGAPVSAVTRVTATVGAESDVAEDQTSGSLDETVWYVGVEWQPSDLQRVELRGGDRFYGSAWEASWNRRGSRGELQLDYSEDPTTTAGVVGDDRLFDPGFPTIDIGTLTSRPFLLKRLNGRAAYTLPRSTLAARIYSDEREYLDQSGDDEEGLGLTVSYDWDVASRTQVGIILTLEQREFDDGRDDDFIELDLRATRRINRVLSAELGYRYFQRDSNVDPDYDSNLISLFLTARFGGSRTAAD